MGVGTMSKPKSVKWGTVKNILLAWIITIPVCMVIAAFMYFLLEKTPIADVL